MNPLFKLLLSILLLIFISVSWARSNELQVLDDQLEQLYDNGKYNEAITVLEKMLALEEIELGPEHIDVATTLHNLANLYLYQARYAEAEPLYQRALAIVEKALGLDHPQVAMTLNYLAELYYFQGRYAEALAYARRTTAIPRTRFTGLGVEETTGLLSEQRESRWHFAVQIDIALNPELGGQRAALEAEVFEVMQLSRTSSAAGALSRMAARLAASDDEMAQLIRQQQDSFAYYEKLDSRLIDALGESTESRDGETISQIRESVKDLEAKIEGLNQTIQETFPEYAELTSREPLSLKATQELLGQDEALLAMVRSWNGEQTHVFVLRFDKSTAYTVELGVSEIEQMVSQLRSGLDFSTGRDPAL